MSSWRDTQKAFAKEDVEFAQDKRILDFFDERAVYGVGDVGYFKDKLNMCEVPQNATQALAIINEPTSDLELLNVLECTKSIDKVCVAINKFIIWTPYNKPDVSDNYDQALLDYIQKIYNNRTIEHFFVKDLKGNHFNFASPTTQFFITNENN